MSGQQYPTWFSRGSFADAAGSRPEGFFRAIARFARRRPGHRFRCWSAARLVRILSAEDDGNGGPALGGGQTPRAAGTALCLGDLWCRRIDARAHPCDGPPHPPCGLRRLYSCERRYSKPPHWPRSSRHSFQSPALLSRRSGLLLQPDNYPLQNNGLRRLRASRSLISRAATRNRPTAQQGAPAILYCSSALEARLMSYDLPSAETAFGESLQ